MRYDPLPDDAGECSACGEPAAVCWTPHGHECRACDAVSCDGCGRMCVGTCVACAAEDAADRAIDEARDEEG